MPQQEFINSSRHGKRLNLPQPNYIKQQPTFQTELEKQKGAFVDFHEFHRPSMNGQTSQLEEVLTQFMEASISTNKNIEASIKKLEMQVEQLDRQLEEKSNNEDCKDVVTRVRIWGM